MKPGKRCPQCGADWTNGSDEIKCPWCGRVDWELFKGMIVGCAIAAGTGYLLKKVFPKLEEKKPWLRKLLDLVK